MSTVSFRPWNMIAEIPAVPAKAEGPAAEAAIKDGTEECLCGLYSDVIAAAEKGEEDTVCELLKIPKNPVPFQKKAVRGAAAYGHIEIVRKLLSGCTNFENSKDELSAMDAIIPAAWGGHVVIAREILTRYPSIKTGKATCAAAERGQTDVIRLFLTHSTISNPARRQAIIEALKNRHIRAVLLLSSG